MLIKSSHSDDARSSEITPRDMYLNRRKFLAGVGLSAVAATGLGARKEWHGPPRCSAEKAVMFNRPKLLISWYEKGSGQAPKRSVPNRRSSESEKK